MAAIAKLTATLSSMATAGASKSRCIPMAATRQAAAAGMQCPMRASGAPEGRRSAPARLVSRIRRLSRVCWIRYPTPAPATPVIVQCEPKPPRPTRNSAEFSTARSGLVPPDIAMALSP
jgi:hypothetical protein